MSDTINLLDELIKQIEYAKNNPVNLGFNATAIYNLIGSDNLNWTSINQEEFAKIAQEAIESIELYRQNLTKVAQGSISPLSPTDDLETDDSYSKSYKQAKEKLSRLLLVLPLQNLL